MTTFTIRRAMSDDSQALSHLMHTNAKENLTPEEREQGFLTGGGLPETALAAMIEDPGFPVATDGTEVIGCTCVSRFEQHEGRALIETMLEACSDVDFHGDDLSEYRGFLYGPAVVARDYRGRGILSNLFENLIEIVPEAFEVGIAFVADKNQKSYAAHTDGLDMTPVTGFEFDKEQYTVLAFPADERNLDEYQI